MMPDMNGIVLMERLKTLNPDVKMIAMSGLATNQESALAAGATLFVSKPYSLEKLLQHVSDLVHDR